MNLLPQCKRSLAERRGESGVSRPQQGKVDRRGTRPSDWPSRLQIVFERAQRTLSPAQHGREASLASASAQADGPGAKPDSPSGGDSWRRNRFGLRRRGAQEAGEVSARGADHPPPAAPPQRSAQDDDERIDPTES